MSPLKGRSGSPDDCAGLARPPVRGVVDGALQALPRGFQFAHQLRREVAPLVDPADETGVGRDCLRRRVAGAGDRRLGEGGLAAAAFERRLRLSKVRQRPPVFGDAAAVKALQAGHEPVRAPHVAQVVHAHQHPEVAAVAHFVELDHAGREVRQLRLGGLLEPGNPDGGVVELALDALELEGAGGELLRAQVALDLELPEVLEQRPLARGKTVGFLLQILDPRRRAGGHGFGARRVLRPAARGEGRGQQQRSCHGRACRPRLAAPGWGEGAAAGGEAWPSHGRQNSGLPSISFGMGTPKYLSTDGPRSTTRGSCAESLRFEMRRPGIVR